MIELLESISCEQSFREHESWAGILNTMIVSSLPLYVQRTRKVNRLARSFVAIQESMFCNFWYIEMSSLCEFHASSHPIELYSNEPLTHSPLFLLHMQQNRILECKSEWMSNSEGKEHL